MLCPWDDRFERVLREIVPTLDPDTEIAPDLQLTHLGLSSLKIVELLMRLESEFGVELSDGLLSFEIFATPATLWASLSQAVAVATPAGTDAP